MNSQRAREDRIVEKLRSGALSPASSSDPAEAVRASLGTQPTVERRCHGCDEPDVDAFIGDHPWHHLCFLFWHGRSETVRERHTRWVIVVRADRPQAYAKLRRNFAQSVWVDIVMDRRGGPSPGRGRAPAVERRGSQRPRGSATSAPAPAYRRAHRGDDFEVYEATGPLPARCPQCGVVVTVELPRLAEPPVRLELTVVHEAIPPATLRHVVEAQSLSATGRVLFALQLRASPGPDST
jgi:hypothetical protein